MKKHKVKNYGFIIALIVIEGLYFIACINPTKEEGRDKLHYLYQFITAKESVYDVLTDKLEGKREEKLIYDVTADSFSECYASDDEGGYYICEMKDSEGKARYLGVFVARAEQSTGPVIEGKGRIFDMSDEEKDTFTAYMLSKGISGDSLYFKLIRQCSFQQLVLFRMTDVLTVILLAFAVFFIFCFLWLRQTERSFRRARKHYEVTKDDLGFEQHHLKNLTDALYSTSKYLFWFKDKAFVIPYRELVWIYINPNKFLALDKLNHLKLVTKDRKKWDIALESMSELNDMVMMIYERCPDAVYGTSKELKKMVRKDFGILLSLVEENRLERLGISD